MTTSEHSCLCIARKLHWKTKETYYITSGMFKYFQIDKVVPFYIFCKIVRKSSVFEDKLQSPNV